MKKIRIGNKLIGGGEPCFIIAETGVNHNGDVELAKKLIDIAKEAGADAVKFQTFKAGNLVTKNAKMAEYQEKNVEEESQLKMLKKLELSYEDFRELKKYCNKKKIIFLSTPHSTDAIDFLESLVPAYKVGSGDLTNLPFLKKIAKKKKPIILSTGMATLDEIEEAVETIKDNGCSEIVLLHCVTSYPTKIEDVNLMAIKILKQEFNLPVGYSDHTISITIPVAAVTLGSCVIEKHFTLDKDMEGPDHKASLEPNELKEMIKAIRDLEKALGDGIKKPTLAEEKIKKVVRKSIVAKIDIPRGTIIKEKMLDIKRPGTGIEPKYIERIVGKKSRESIRKDEAVRWEMIE